MKQKHASHQVNHNLHQHIYHTDDVNEVFKGTHSMSKEEIDKLFPIEDSKSAEVTDDFGTVVINKVGKTLSAIAGAVSKDEEDEEQDSK